MSLLLFFVHKTSLTPTIFIKLPYQEKFVDTKGVIRIRKFKKDRQDDEMAKWKKEKGQTTIYKALHLKLKSAVN